MKVLLKYRGGADEMDHGNPQRSASGAPAAETETAESAT
jgi:hypothetical protein